jgi:citrate lyase synthetase
LISIAETGHGSYIPEGISDLLFYEKLGKKEIVTIDNIKYEKAQYVDSPMKEDEVDYVSIWALMVCGEIYGHGHKCVSVFQAGTAVGLVTQTDVVTNQWTILRNLD